MLRVCEVGDSAGGERRGVATSSEYAHSPCAAWSGYRTLRTSGSDRTARQRGNSQPVTERLNFQPVADRRRQPQMRNTLSDMPLPISPATAKSASWEPSRSRSQHGATKARAKRPWVTTRAVTNPPKERLGRRYYNPAPEQKKTQVEVDPGPDGSRDTTSRSALSGARETIGADRINSCC